MHKPAETRVFREGACLASLDRSRIACGDWTPDPETAAHLRECASCGEQVAEETALVRAMSLQAVPAVIQQESERLRADAGKSTHPWVRLALGLSTAALCAGLALVVLPARDAGPVGAVRLKGPGALAISVMRGDQLAFDDEPIEKVHDLHLGDRLRVHVLATSTPWMALQVREADGWQSSFEGAPPADGWLPFALEITTPDATRLRWVRCGEPVADADAAIGRGVCQAHEFTL